MTPIRAEDLRTTDIDTLRARYNFLNGRTNSSQSTQHVAERAELVRIQLELMGRE